MKQIELKTLKSGEYFRLKNNEIAPLWVRGEYERSSRKYSTYKYDDVNHETLRKGSVKVWVEIY